MTKAFLDTVFTDSVKQAQSANGSRKMYGRLDSSPDEGPDVLTEFETEFIQTRDSFYMATTSSSGWPYMQHRGGPVGFVKVLNANTFAIVDFRGNRQYVSLGNIAENNRVCLFFMDYACQARLKVLARVEIVDVENNESLIEALRDADYKAKIERAMLFHLHSFDWNCPQHITPKFSKEDIEPVIDELKQKIEQLEAQLAKT